MKNHCFCALAVLVGAGCQSPLIELNESAQKDSSVSALCDTLIAQNDTALFYLSGIEYSNITLEAYPTPQAIITDPRYRMPTKLEASDVLRKAAIPSEYWKSRQRILCYDVAAHTYYTFTTGGNVTRAGYKTVYSLLPIRTERTSEQGKWTITINDQWQH